MKKVFKRIVLFVTAIFLLFMFSCSEESSVETIQTETKIHVIKKSNLSLDKIKEKAILLNTINALSLKQEEYKKSTKLVYDSINEFYIDTDNIILQEGDLGKSYTFSIIRENKSPYVENLTIHINDQNQSMALLTIYNLSETEKNIILNNGVVPNINQKLLVFPINELPSQFLSGYTHKETTDPTAINVYQLPNGQCGVIDHIESLGDEGSMIYYTIVECPTENSGGSSNSGSSSSSSTGFTFGYDYTISSNESSSGNTNQTTGGGSSSGNYITPHVMPADQLRKKEFLINLKSNDINAFNWFNQQSSETQNAILTYLEDSLNNDGLILTEYSQEAVGFVKAYIESMQNEEVESFEEFIDAFINDEWNEDENSQQRNTLCGSYNFVTVGNASVANISGLGMSVRRGFVAMDISFTNSLCITIPYTIPTQSSSLFKTAWNVTISEVYTYLNATYQYTSPSYETLKSLLIEFLSVNLGLIQMGATVSTSPCIGNIPTTQATYCP